MTRLLIALAVLGAVTVPATGRAAGQGAATVDVVAVVHDPLAGTHTVAQALEQVQYAGGLPQQWSVRTPSGMMIGTIVHDSTVHYRAVSAGHYRLSLEYRVWVKSRIFAAGFEP